MKLATLKGLSRGLCFLYGAATLGACLIWGYIAFTNWDAITTAPFGAPPWPALFTNFGGWVAVYIATVIIGVRLYNGIVAREQADIDAHALEAAHNGERYFLYLRSFSFEDEVQIPDDNPQSRKHVCGSLAVRTSLQFYVSTALRPVAPTLGIGGYQRAGITKYPTDDARWHDDFDRLARRCQAIFVLPSLTEGSQWELFWLLENALEKTVFVVPPTYAVRRRAQDDFWRHYREFILALVDTENLQAATAFKSKSGGLFQLRRNTSGSLKRCEVAPDYWELSPRGIAQAAEDVEGRLTPVRAAP